MIRRQFLKALGLAPAAAPALAKMAAEGMTINTSLPAPAYGMGGYDRPAPEQDELSFLRNQLSILTRNRARRYAELVEFHRTTRPMLDPDLAAMRSFSASALIQIQAERNAKRALHSEERTILQRLHDLIPSGGA